MKNLLIISIVFLLSGCPGGGRPASVQRNVLRQGDTICFTINKNDVLKRYSIYYWPGGKYTVIKAGDGVFLTYPDTCFKIKLQNGYRYDIAYSLNGKSYSDSFFIDRDGN